ncbi:MAG: ACP S-malonyltransferase [Agarilytica sp.]
MLAMMFPGQGSQKKGMGAELFDSVPEFLSVESEIDDILGFSVRKTCLENPNNVLKQTEFTQPCLFIVNALHYYALKSQDIKPDVLIGHSLGEFNALLAAGAFDFLTGVKLVKKRGELMSKAKSGGMAAVVGLTKPAIQNVIHSNTATGIDIANFNSHHQIVISGDKDQIEQLADQMKLEGAKAYIPLPVSAAFHSRFMGDAAQNYLKFLADFTFKKLAIPVVSNVTAHPYPYGDPSITIKAYLYRQITQSVKWYQSIEYLYSIGVTDLKEVGPGVVLTKLKEGIPRSVEESTELLETAI